LYNIYSALLNPFAVIFMSSSVKKYGDGSPVVPDVEQSSLKFCGSSPVNPAIISTTFPSPAPPEAAVSLCILIGTAPRNSSSVIFEGSIFAASRNSFIRRDLS